MKSKVFLALLIIVILSVTAIGCSNQGKIYPTSIEVPDGPKINVSFEETYGMDIVWNTLKFQDYQFKIGGTITNTSDKTVTFSQISYWVQGNQRGFNNGTTLKQNENFNFSAGIVGVNEKDSILLRIDEFREIKNSAVMAASIPQETVTKTPTTTPTTVNEEETDLVFTKNPGDPKTPEEIAAAFYFLCDEGKYTEAERLTSDDFISPDEMKILWEGFLQHYEHKEGAHIEKIRIDTSGLNPQEEYVVWCIIYFSDKSTRDCRVMKDVGDKILIIR